LEEYNVNFGSVSMNSDAVKNFSLFLKDNYHLKILNMNKSMLKSGENAINSQLAI